MGYYSLRENLMRTARINTSWPPLRPPRRASSDLAAHRIPFSGIASCRLLRLAPLARPRGILHPHQIAPTPPTLGARTIVEFRAGVVRLLPEGYIRTRSGSPADGAGSIAAFIHLFSIRRGARGQFGGRTRRRRNTEWRSKIRGIRVSRPRFFYFR